MPSRSDSPLLAILFDEDVESHMVVQRLMLVSRQGAVLLNGKSNLITRVGLMQECTQLGPLADCFSGDSIQLGVKLINESADNALAALQSVSSRCQLTDSTISGHIYSVDLPTPPEKENFFIHVYRRNNGSIGGHVYHSPEVADVSFTESVTYIEVFIADDSIPASKRHFRLVLVRQYLISVELAAYPDSDVSIDGAALLQEHGHTPSRLFLFKKLMAKVTWDDTFGQVEDHGTDISITVAGDPDEASEIGEVSIVIAEDVCGVSISADSHFSADTYSVSLMLPPEESSFVSLWSQSQEEDSFFSASSAISHATEPPSVVDGYVTSESRVVFTPSMLINGFDSDYAPSEVGKLEQTDVEVDQASLVAATTDDDLADIYEDTDEAEHVMDSAVYVAESVSVAREEISDEALMIEALRQQTEQLRAEALGQQPPKGKLHMCVAHKDQPRKPVSAKKESPKRLRPKSSVPALSKPEIATLETGKRMPKSATQLRRALSAVKPKPAAEPAPAPLPKRPRVPKQVPRAKSPPKPKPERKTNQEAYIMFVAACGGRSGETTTKDYTRCLSPITRSILERTSRPTWEPDAPAGGSQILRHRPETSPMRRPPPVPTSASGEMVLASGDYRTIRDRRTQSARFADRRIREPECSDFELPPLGEGHRAQLDTPSRHGLSCTPGECTHANSNLLTVVQAGSGVSTPFTALQQRPASSYKKTLVTNTLCRPSSAQASINKKLRLSPCPVNAIWYRQLYIAPRSSQQEEEPDKQSAGLQNKGSPSSMKRKNGFVKAPVTTEVWRSETIVIPGVLKRLQNNQDSPLKANASGDDTSEHSQATEKNYVACDLSHGPCRDVFHGHYDVGLSVTLDYAQLVDMNGPASGDHAVTRKTWLIAHGADAEGLDAEGSVAAAASTVDRSSGNNNNNSAEEDPERCQSVSLPPSPRNLKDTFRAQSAPGALVVNSITTSVFGDTCCNTITLISGEQSQGVIENPHVRCGDELISIDGWDVCRMNVEQIRELVSGTNESARAVTLTVRRYVKVPVSDLVGEVKPENGPALLVTSSLLLINRNVLPFDDITLSRAEIIKKKQAQEMAARLGKIPVLHKLITPDEISKVDKSKRPHGSMVRSVSAKAVSGSSPQGFGTKTDVRGSQTAAAPSERRDRLIDFALSRQLIRPSSAIAAVPILSAITPEGSAFFGQTGSRVLPAGQRMKPQRKKMHRKSEEKTREEVRLGAFTPSTKPTPLPYGCLQVRFARKNISLR